MTVGSKVQSVFFIYKGKLFPMNCIDRFVQMHDCPITISDHIYIKNIEWAESSRHITGKKQFGVVLVQHRVLCGILVAAKWQLNNIGPCGINQFRSVQFHRGNHFFSNKYALVIGPWEIHGFAIVGKGGIALVGFGIDVGWKWFNVKQFFTFRNLSLI